MEVLNYLRQAIEDMPKKILPSLKENYYNDYRMCKMVLKVATASPKFILPTDGHIFNDNLKGLPEELKLPYPEIVIEYTVSDNIGLSEKIFGEENTIKAKKRIIIAVQHKDTNTILVYSIVEMRGIWTMLPFYAELFRATNLNKKADSEWLGVDENELIEGLGIKVIPTGTLALSVLGPNWEKNAYVDLSDEVGTVLELIEALSCSNVTHEALPRRKLNKSAKKNGALPFDEYRVLTIKTTNEDRNKKASLEGNHRSPREHLRRGHIRHLATKKVWVNSCVVNPGTKGKINTVYKIT